MCPKSIGQITKIYNLENYILGLTESGQFVEICPYTKTLLKINDGNLSKPIEDL
jgi:hypothetical protein